MSDIDILRLMAAVSLPLSFVAFLFTVPLLARASGLGNEYPLLKAAVGIAIIDLFSCICITYVTLNLSVINSVGFAYFCVFALRACPAAMATILIWLGLALRKSDPTTGAP